jgi:uncharacterized protein YjbJ (UPF0337 family)
MRGPYWIAWGKLTDDDLNVINGKRDQLEGRIQQRYGYAKDQAKKDVDDRTCWKRRLDRVDRRSARSARGIRADRMSGCAMSSALQTGTYGTGFSLF